VGNNPNPVSLMRRVDGASRNNKRLAGVVLGFQVRETSVEAHSDEVSNILANNPSGSEFFNNAEHFWPEITVVELTSFMAGNGKRLAREASGEEVDGAGVAEVSDVAVLGEFSNVSIDGGVGPVLLKHGLAERLVVAKSDDAMIRPNRLSCESKAAYPTE
jgi:hypothetical protein